MLSKNRLDYMITDLALRRFYAETCLCLPDFGILCPLENSVEIQYQLSENSETFQHLLLRPHEFFLFQPDLPVKLIPEDVSVCLLVRLNPAFLLNLFPAEQLDLSPIYRPASQLSSGTLYAFLKLAHLYITDQKTYELQIISNLYHSLESLFTFSAPAVAKTIHERHSEKRKEMILSYIDEHIQETFKLTETAQAIGLTPQYLSSWFQKNFDCTFSNYILSQKIETVKSWLHYTRLSDLTLTEQFHFKDTLSFQNAFAQYCKVSPSQYRARFQKEEQLQPPAAETKLPLSPYFDALLSVTTTPETVSFSPSQKDETIHRISARNVKSLPDSWRYLLNMGYAYQFNDNRMQAQLKEIQQAVHFKYGRICRLLDLTTIHSINNIPRYGFEHVFQLLDEMNQLHLIPFIELGYKHAKVHLQFLETQILTIDDQILSYYSKVLQILPDFLRACCNRYGINVVSTWQFSLYYDLIEEREQISTLTFRQYLEYYGQLRSVIKQLLPDARVGGADFNIYVPFDVWEEKLRILKTQQIDLDFLSLNAYGGVQTGEQTHLALDSGYMAEKIAGAVQLMETYFPHTPVLITEFNFCYTSRNYLNDMVFTSCFLARFLNQNLHLVRGMGYFTMSDLSVSYSDSEDLFLGGNGLFNCIGLPKPAYHIYSFFHELGARIIAQTGNYLITTDSDYRFQGIFTNYVHINEQAAYSRHNEKLLDTPEQLFESMEAQSLHIQIEQAVPGTYLLKTYTVNAFHGNLLPHWAKCRSITTLSEHDFRTFKQLAQPSISLSTKNVAEDGLLDFSLNLEPLEVKLVLIDYIEN